MISSGRKARGPVYFEVPVNAESIEIEYDVGLWSWSNEKITFIVK